MMNAKAKTVWEHWYGNATKAHDVCGAEMDKSAHGKEGRFGWDVDHIVPLSRGGTNSLSNLRPLHWENNDAKGNKLDGQWHCAKTS